MSSRPSHRARMPKTRRDKPLGRHFCLLERAPCTTIGVSAEPSQRVRNDAGNLALQQRLPPSSDEERSAGSDSANVAPTRRTPLGARYAVPPTPAPCPGRGQL